MVDTCPTGITFGNTITLSPNGEKVLNPHTAHFNNGDYVVVWTEKTLSGPRLEFQLFNGTSNQKISSTPTEGVAVYPASQTDPWLRIGTTAVGVYEDYTFVIAWSTLERTRDPWNIHVNTYKYDVINSEYTKLGDTINKIPSSNDNHGKFGFTTFSLNNAFAIAYKIDRYTIKIPVYKKSTNEYTVQNTITEKVTASYLMEMIVNAVPTQYFFSVIWSPLMNGRGITVQNYKIEDQSRISSRLQITVNPRDIKADLSYGGTSTVAWHEASDDCDRQNYLTYTAQMLSDISLLGDSFSISVSTDDQDLDTYLQSVITQSTTRVVATFLKKEITGNKYIVRIFDNNGNLVESNSELLTNTAPAPNSALAREAIVMSPNSGSDHQICRRGREGVSVGVDEDVKYVSESMPSQIFVLYESILVHKGGNADRDILLGYVEKISQQRQQLFIREVVTDNTRIQWQRNFGHVMKNFMPPLLFFVEAPTNDIGYRFDCSTPLDILIDEGHMEVSICNGWHTKKDTVGVFYNTAYGATAKGVMAFSKYKDPLKDYNLIPNFDNCVISAESGYLHPIPLGCLQYYIEGAGTLLGDFCKISAAKGKICNVTGKKQTDLSMLLELLVIHLENLSKLGYDELVDPVKKEYESLLGLEAQGWPLIQRLLKSIANYLSKEYNMNYGPATNICYHKTEAGEFAAAFTSGREYIFFCQPFIDAGSLPKTIDDETRAVTILHEVSHIFGTKDDENGHDVYGQEECKNWVSNLPEKPKDITGLVADCVAIFIQSYICSQMQECKISREGSVQSINNKEVVMKKQDLIQFGIDIEVTTNRTVTLTLSLTNNAPHDYWIASRAILQNGFTHMPFSISGPSVIPCFDTTARQQNSNLMRISAGETITNTINLSEFCLFNDAIAGQYQINYQHIFHLYNESNYESYYTRSLAEEYANVLGNVNFSLSTSSGALNSDHGVVNIAGGSGINDLA